MRRERLFDKEGRNLLDYLDPRRYTILPNTAGCFSAEDALRTARLGRELLQGLDNPGASWVKLEVLADTRTLLPDPLATLEATQILVKEGFDVLCYTSDDPVMARRLKEAGAASVMPAGSPIGSGQGVLNPNNIRIILEDLKGADPSYPVIVDAGVGTASDVTIAMELGCDGVLLNTGIAGRERPAAHGARDAAGRGIGLAGSRRRANPAQAVCDRVEPYSGRCWEAMMARTYTLLQAHPMKFTGEEYYRAGIERMRQSREIHSSGGSYALAIYTGGLAVECMLRAFRWNKDRSFEGRHDLEDLLKSSDFLSINEERSREPGCQTS